MAHTGMECGHNPKIAAEIYNGEVVVVVGKPAEDCFRVAGRGVVAHITGEQKAAFKTWIEDGAPWPKSRAGRIHKKTYRVELDDYL